MFRFTIRELILLTVIVAMGAAWWVDRRQLSIAARKMHNYERLSTELAEELKSKYPATEISITIDGRSVDVFRKLQPGVEFSKD